MNLSSGPVKLRVIFSQPGVSQNDGVLLPEVQHEEILSRVLSIDPEMQFNLVANHSSLIVGSISISGVHWPSEFLQWTPHSSGEMKVDATDSCSTVD